VRSQRNIILATASSGIAATLMPGGRTTHSAFKLPLDIHRQEQPILKISPATAKGRLLRECVAIIWDECTMSHKRSLEALERTLRELRKNFNSSFFGGVIIILAGDFRQTLPVIPRSTPADELDACLKQSTLWSRVEKLRLTINMRVHRYQEPGAEEFCRKLLMIGEGRAPLNDRHMVKFPPSFCQLVNSRDALIERIFGDLPSKITDLDWLRQRALLAPKNETVDELNSRIQDMLTDRPTSICYSRDSTVESDDAVRYPIEFLNSLSPSGFPPHRLEIKVGSPIILLRNLDPPRLCNGTRLVVKYLRNNVIAATILAGEHRGQNVLIPRIPLISTDLIFQFKRTQFPVRLAYAITINKSQGQSLGVAGLDLSTPCFSHGQLYVACSRVGRPSNLIVYAPNGETKNIVYEQALT